MCTSEILNSDSYFLNMPASWYKISEVVRDCTCNFKRIQSNFCILWWWEKGVEYIKMISLPGFCTEYIPICHWNSMCKLKHRSYESHTDQKQDSVCKGQSAITKIHYSGQYKSTDNVQMEDILLLRCLGSSFPSKKD